MKYADLDIKEWVYQEEYTSKCRDCFRQITLRTQKDDSPEYTTTITIACDCGGVIEFTLPVN